MRLPLLLYYNILDIKVMKLRMRNRIEGLHINYDEKKNKILPFWKQNKNMNRTRNGVRESYYYLTKAFNLSQPRKPDK